MAMDFPTLLFKTSSLYFGGAAFAHAYASVRTLFPFFGDRGNAFEAFVFKLLSLQLSGYFAINGLLIWRWAEKGILDGYDQAIMVTLVGMNTLSGLAFVQRGYWRPAPVPLMLGTSAMIVIGQLMRNCKNVPE